MGIVAAIVDRVCSVAHAIVSTVAVTAGSMRTRVREALTKAV
jgi:hypothetical protein